MYTSLKWVLEFTEANGHKAPPSSLKELWAVLSEKVSKDPHLESLPETVDHLGTSGILVSTHHDLGHANSNLGYYLGRIAPFMADLNSRKS